MSGSRAAESWEEIGFFVKGASPLLLVASLSRGAGEDPWEGGLGLEVAWGELSVVGKASSVGRTGAAHCGPWAGLHRLGSLMPADSRQLAAVQSASRLHRYSAPLHITLCSPQWHFIHPFLPYVNSQALI